MTCDHARCDADATTACRMGDGYVRRRGIKGKTKPYRQTYVRYCDPHLETVGLLFVLCDIRPLDQLTQGRAGGGMHRRR